MMMMMMMMMMIFVHYNCLLRIKWKVSVVRQATVCKSSKFSGYGILLNTFYTIPWAGDRLVTRHLPIQDNTNTEKTQAHIHAASGIRTRDANGRQ
jgi:hypothetical protein